MSKLDRRIERLEEMMGAKAEPRVVVITINPDSHPENSSAVDLHSRGLWAYAIRGGPFTEDEIYELREGCKEDKL